MFNQKKTSIYLWTNNSLLEDIYFSCQTETIEFKKYSKLSSKHYLLIHLDLDSDLSYLTSNLYPLLSSAADKETKILVCLSLSTSSQTPLLEKYLGILNSLYEKNINLRTLTIYDLYTLNSNYAATSFDSYISKILSEKNINISKKNDKTFYPISLNQCLAVYEKLFFLNSTQFKNYHLAGIPIKDSDLAYYLNRLYQEKNSSEIDINLSSESYTTVVPYQKVFETQAEINIKIEDLFFDNLKKYFNNQSVDVELEKTIKTKNTLLGSILAVLKKKNFKKKLEEKGDLHIWALKKIELFVLKIILIVTFIFSVSSMLFIGGSYYALKSIESSSFYLKKGDLQKTASNYQKARISMAVVNTNLQVISPVLNLLAKNVDLKSHNIVSFLDFSLSTFDGLVQSYVLLEKIYNSLNSPHNMDYNTTFLAVKSNLQQVYESLNQIEILLTALDLPKPVLETIQKNSEFENLKKIKENIWELNKIIDVAAPLLGSEKNTNIYILVQNYNQLRPTGGVIELVYQLSIEKGKVIFIKSFVPQEIDALSDLIINSPPLIEKLTGDSLWKLKDMNYNPDFSQTSTNINWYLENKLKTKADFIIGLNLKVLETFLSSKNIKPLLNSDITYEQFIADTQAGNLANQVKTLTDNVLNKILNHEIPLVDLIQVIADNKNNFNLWSSDPKLQSQMQNLNLAKVMNQKECLPAISTSRKCIPQTIHLNLSNFSNIPLNGYLDREVNIVSTPQVLTVDHEIVLKSKYQKSTPLINRNLTEVVQLYVSKGSVLNSIELNNESIDLKEVITQTEKDLIRFQFTISTPLNKEYVLSIKYSNQLQERTVLPIAYSYNIIPQVGLEYKKQALEFNIPDSSRVSAITSKVESFPNKIVVNLKDKDHFGYNLVGR